MAIESQVPKRLSIFQKFEPKLAVWTEFTNTLRTEQLIKFVNKFIVSTLLKREVVKLVKDFKLYAQLSGCFCNYLSKLKIMRVF